MMNLVGKIRKSVPPSAGMQPPAEKNVPAASRSQAMTDPFTAPWSASSKPRTWRKALTWAKVTPAPTAPQDLELADRSAQLNPGTPRSAPPAESNHHKLAQLYARNAVLLQD